MDALSIIACGAAGTAVGAWVRVATRDAVVARGVASWRSTLTVNLVGSALAGALVTVATDTAAHALVVAGFLGGLTTFSSMAVECVALWLAGKRRVATGIMCATVGLGPVAAWVGALVVGALATPTPAVKACAAAAKLGTTPDPSRRVPHHAVGLALVAAGAVAGGVLRTGTTTLFRDAGGAAWQAVLLMNIVGGAVAGFAFRYLNAVGPDGAPLQSSVKRLTIERTVILGFAGGMTSLSAISMDVVIASDRSLLEAVEIGFAHLALGLPATIGGWWLASKLCPHRPTWEKIVAPPCTHRGERHAGGLRVP